MRGADHKKQHERFLLERFLEAAKLQAEVTEEREAPDFIICFEGRPIGVEVTELFISHDTSQNLPQVQESLSSRIISCAQQLYQASGARPAHVTVCFRPDCDLRNLSRDDTAAKLAFFVQGLNLSEWQRVDWRPEELHGQLTDEISFVHALGVPKSEMAHWGVARAGWAAPLTADTLQSRIEEKSTRLLKYKGTVTENWLVIVADGTKPSQLFDARSEFDTHAILSPFSRSFFYGHPERVVIELGV
jgi:hypothetical protein